MWEQAKQEANWGLYKITKSKDGLSKKPHNPEGRDGVKSDWSAGVAFHYTLAEAQEWVQKLHIWYQGRFKYEIGYLPREGSAMVGLDFDKVWKDRSIAVGGEWIAPMLTASESYMELSPSGTGIRVLVPREDGDTEQHGEQFGAGFLASEIRGFTVTFQGKARPLEAAPIARQAIAARRGEVGPRAGRRDYSHLPPQTREDLYAPVGEGAEDQLEMLLNCIGGFEDYDQRVKVRLAVIGAFGKDDFAFESFDNWERQFEDYSEGVAYEKWGRENDPRNLGWLWLNREATRWAEQDILKKQEAGAVNQAEILQLFKGNVAATVNRQHWKSLTKDDWVQTVATVMNMLPADMREDAFEAIQQHWFSVKEGQNNG